MKMTFGNRSRTSHHDPYTFPSTGSGSDSVELEFKRALVTAHRANTWLYEDVARRSAAPAPAQEVFSDDDGYTADTEAEAEAGAEAERTSYRPPQQVLYRKWRNGRMSS